MTFTTNSRTNTTRALVGAFYGILGGATFSFVAAWIDVWLNSDLPIGVDWSLFGTRLLLIGLSMALIGAVTCWWDETWQGLVSGSIVSAALALAFALLSSTAGTGMKLVVLVFILFPIAAMAMPVAWLLRRLTERHGVALHSTGKRIRIAWLIVTAIALGAICGYFMKLPAKGSDATRYVNEALQNLTTEGNPVVDFEGVQERDGVSYKLYPTVSATSTEGYDVRVQYEDGFSLTCTVITYPSRPPYLSVCKPDGE